MIAAECLEPTENPGSDNFEIPKPREIPDELLPKVTKRNLESLTPAEKEYILDLTKLTIDVVMNRNRSSIPTLFKKMIIF